MSSISKENLKDKFISLLKDELVFDSSEQNPFLIKVFNKEYFIFLKYLTPAYFKESPDITRIQLPFSLHYTKIIESRIPFIVIGYDDQNNVFVNWDPTDIKQRLNTRKNVSLYSRASIQLSANSINSEFIHGTLKSGSKFIVFKAADLSLFFKNIDLLYSKDHTGDLNGLPLNNLGKLHQIDDEDILYKIIPLLKDNQILEAVNVCSILYGNKGYEMGFKDWFQLVNQTYNDLQD